MSCFSCSKAMKMVEDPIEKAKLILQDLSGIVLEVEVKVDAEVIQDLSGIVLEVEAKVDAEVIKDLSGIVIQIGGTVAIISDVVEKVSKEIEEFTPMKI